MRSALGLGVVCALAGFGAGYVFGSGQHAQPEPRAEGMATQRTAPPTEQAPAPSPAARPLASTASPTDGEDEVASLKARLAQADLACAMRVAAAGGVEPLPWPEDDIPSLVRPEEAEAMMAELHEACPNFAEAKLEMDCGEFPCGTFYRGMQDWSACTGDTTGILRSYGEGSIAAGPDAFTVIWLEPEYDDLDPATWSSMKRRKQLRFEQIYEIYKSDPPTD